MAQQNPLEELMLTVLNANGFDKLDEDARKTYLPQFLAHAEQRIGSALLPLLNEASANEFVAMTKREAKPQEWLDFWHKNVVNFDEVVKQTLVDFVDEVKEAFQF